MKPSRASDKHNTPSTDDVQQLSFHPTSADSVKLAGPSSQEESKELGFVIVLRDEANAVQGSMIQDADDSADDEGQQLESISEQDSEHDSWVDKSK